MVQDKELGKKRCEICRGMATSVIRSMYTCNNCYSIFAKDNKRLTRTKDHITKTKNIQKECYMNRCHNLFEIPINEIKNKVYCSDYCESVSTKKESEAFKYLNNL